MNALEWFEFIASYGIQVVFVIAIAAGLDRWTTSASVKARIWNTCFVSLLGMVAIGLLLPRLQLFHPWSALQPKALLMVAQIESVLGATLLAVWAFGTAVMLIRWTIRFVIMQRFIGSRPLLTASEQTMLSDCIPSELLSVGKRAVEFRVCPEDFAPFCYQFHQPIVFLPSSLLKSDSETLGHVLYHELIHLHTQHPLQLFCQKFVQCLLWFHPLVWMSSNRAGLIREFVCDDASALHAQSTTAYLKALITVAEETLKRTEGTLAIGQSKGELLTRVRRLSDTSPSQSAGNGYAAITVLVIAGLLGSQIWLPTNPLSSQRSDWSPWPSWSAEALHALNMTVRDYEIFQHGNQLHEWIEVANEESAVSAP
jgi:beta-lactamase regulating signal transducer with metallopeptidase domain